MSKLLTAAMVESAILKSFTVNCDATGSGTPNTWKVLVSTTFYCSNDKGEHLAVFMSDSSDNARIPYFVIAEGLENKPTDEEVVKLFNEKSKEFLEWVAKQKKELDGI